MSDYQKIKGRTWAVAFFFPALDDENVKQKFRWSPSLFGASSTSHFVPLWTLKTDKKQKGVVYITFTRSCCVCVFSPSWSPIYIIRWSPPPYYSSRQLYRGKKWRLYMHSAPERLSCVCVCVCVLAAWELICRNGQQKYTPPQTISIHARRETALHFVRLD